MPELINDEKVEKDMIAKSETVKAAVNRAVDQ
jgi:hypothetical protein